MKIGRTYLGWEIQKRKKSSARPNRPAFSNHRNQQQWKWSGEIGPVYRCYIDEMGHHHNPSTAQPQDRFLTLAGCIFKIHPDYEDAARAAAVFKEEYWPNRNPDNPVIFHREDILYKRGAFGILADAKVKEGFDADLLGFLQRLKMVLIVVILDKQAHKEKYINADECYSWCLEMLLQRYIGFLHFVAGQKGDVMAEARGKIEDRTTMARYKSIYTEGGMFLDKERAQSCLTSREIKIKPKSANILGLQVADLVGPAVQRKILVEKGFQGDFEGTFHRKVYQAIEGKLNRNQSTGRVESYGEIFAP